MLFLVFLLSLGRPRCGGSWTRCRPGQGSFHFYFSVLSVCCVFFLFKRCYCFCLHFLKHLVFIYIYILFRFLFCLFFLFGCLSLGRPRCGGSWTRCRPGQGAFSFHFLFHISDLFYVCVRVFLFFSSFSLFFSC